MVWLLLSPIVLALAWYVYACFLVPEPARGLRVTIGSVDIMGGRVRYERYVLGVKVGDEVSETELSKAYRELVGEPPPPVWKCTNFTDMIWTFAEETGDTDYGLPAALACLVVEMFPASEGALFTVEAQKAFVVNFFGLLRLDPYQAEEYADKVLMLAIQRNKPDKPTVDAKDLPAIGSQGAEALHPSSGTLDT